MEDNFDLRKERLYERRAQINDVEFLKERCAGDPFMADYVPKPHLSAVPTYDRVDTYFVFSERRISA